MNGILAIFSLLPMPFRKRRAVQFSVWSHMAISLGVPASAAVLDGIIIFPMGLSGYWLSHKIFASGRTQCIHHFRLNCFWPMLKAGRQAQPSEEGFTP